MIPKLKKISLVFFQSLLCASYLLADFSLVCPPDVTVSCREDYLHDLNVFGKAYTDYNGIIQYQHDCKTTIEVDECGKGTIKRVWGVENPETWQWLTCMQVITISNVNGFVYTDITWPQSLTIRSCNPQEDLKNLVSPYDAPSWERPKCAKPMLSYKDTHFRVDDGCEKIIREWKILDWCQYDPILFPGRGIFTYTQVIKLVSVSDGVQLLCKKDTVVLNNKSCDSIFVQFDSAVFQSACKIFHKIYNTSKYALHSGANASGYYPNGVTKFNYIAEYACGTEVKCEVIVDVRNKLQPTPYCLTGVIFSLMPVDENKDGVIDNGMVEVWASDLDKGSWHKCPKQSLHFSFSKDVLDRSRVYTCKDVGQNEIEIWVTDSLGNQDLCKTKIEIQNNNPNIPNCDGNLKGGTSSIQGKIIFYNTEPATNIQIHLLASGLNMNTIPDNRNTFQYEFKDLPRDQSYMIKSQCDQLTSSTLNNEDLIYLKKIIDGKIKPVSPYMFFAADINQDYVIDIMDYNVLKQIIQYKKQNLLINRWVFVPESFVFTNPSDPLKEIMPLGIEVLKLDHDMKDQNFIAIRVGDLIGKVTKESDLEIRLDKNFKTANFELQNCYVSNAINGKSTISWNVISPTPQALKIQLISMDGKLLLNKKIHVSEGLQTFNTEISATGLIFYNLYNDAINFTGKLMVGH